MSSQRAEQVVATALVHQRVGPEALRHLGVAGAPHQLDVVYEGRAVGPLVGAWQRRHAALRLEGERVPRLAVIQRRRQVLELRRQEVPVVEQLLHAGRDRAGIVGAREVTRDDDELAVARAVLVSGELHRSWADEVRCLARANCRRWMTPRRSRRAIARCRGVRCRVEAAPSCPRRLHRLVLLLPRAFLGGAASWSPTGAVEPGGAPMSVRPVAAEAEPPPIQEKRSPKHRRSRRPPSRPALDRVGQANPTAAPSSGGACSGSGRSLGGSAPEAASAVTAAGGSAPAATADAARSPPMPLAEAAPEPAANGQAAVNPERGASASEALG